jgi:hypothetical protein
MYRVIYQLNLCYNFIASIRLRIAAIVVGLVRQQPPTIIFGGGVDSDGCKLFHVDRTKEIAFMMRLANSSGDVHPVPSFHVDC